MDGCNCYSNCRVLNFKGILMLLWVVGTLGKLCDCLLEKISTSGSLWIVRYSAHCRIYFILWNYISRQIHIVKFFFFFGCLFSGDFDTWYKFLKDSCRNTMALKLKINCFQLIVILLIRAIVLYSFYFYILYFRMQTIYRSWEVNICGLL
jgi:hypothetical protein